MIVRGLIVAAVLVAASLPASPALGAPELPEPVACPGCWVPAAETSWQWQLSGYVDTSFDVQMYDVDGFDVSTATVAELHDGGAAVVCYLSAGSWERWRPDADRFPVRVLGRDNGWPGERWLDIRARRVLRPILRDRLDMCVRKGFDGVEWDNVDGWSNRTGFPLSRTHQLRFNVMLANLSHRRGLTVFLKNDLGQIPRLLPYFDAALNEQCHQYRECDRLRPFTDAGKAVFGVEYRLSAEEFCAEANAAGYNFLVKRLALGAWRVPC